MAFAMQPWQRSSTTAICWLPESHFLDKHGLPTGNVTSHLWWMECKRPLWLSWNPEEPAEPLFYNGHKLPPSCVSCKNIPHFQTMSSTSPPHISVFKQNQKRSFHFWVLHWWCQCFTRTSISLWILPRAAVADPGSGTDLRLVPMDSLVLSRFGCSCYFAERPSGTRKKNCTPVRTCVRIIYIYSQKF